MLIPVIVSPEIVTQFWKAGTEFVLDELKKRGGDAVADRLKELMRLLGLTFGGIDLVLTPDGDYVFLEVNPSGQWLWLDDKLTLGISDAIASWLHEGDMHA